LKSLAWNGGRAKCNRSVHRLPAGDVPSDRYDYYTVLFGVGRAYGVLAQIRPPPPERGAHA